MKKGSQKQKTLIGSYKKMNPNLSPEWLKTLTLPQLKELATEIRQRIIDVMAVNGGHLASNLGAVELTIALHRVFSSPKDKLIWDVSHQTYTHKLITGRDKRFDRVRQFKGLCGFSNPKESPFDHFYAGHAGTALSLALGVAKTRDLTKEDEFVIPIIGDATLTCGVSLEALNNIPKELKRFVVILNDNRMSISNNVGAITRILSKMINNPTVSKFHQELDHFISKIPGFGSLLSKQGHKFAESVKNLFSPGAFFEHYGLSYIGPIDGHDIGKLTETFEKIKGIEWPVLVHVHTNKGQGLEEAVNNPITWHGVKPFDKNTCKFLPTKSNKSTFPSIFGKHLLKMAEKDPTIVAVTPAMSKGSSLDGFIEKYPERCIDVGIAESHSITYCGGIAYGNKSKVVASIYATFLQRAFDNLFHDVCLQELPVVFAIDRAGISGPDGSTHHGIYDISFLNAMPNMIIAQPRDGRVLKELLNSAFSYGRPTAIRYPNLETDEEGEPQFRELGQGELLAEGEDLLIVALGHMVSTAMEVREKLAIFGISASVMDPVFVKPLDSELICKLLVKHHRVVTIEEHSVISGLGAILNHFLMSQGYSHIQVLNLGIPETYLEQGTNRELLDSVGLSSDKIVASIKRQFFLSGKLFFDANIQQTGVLDGKNL